MRQYPAVVLLLAVTVADAQVQPFQDVRLDITFVCQQLQNAGNDPAVAAILRSQLNGIEIKPTDMSGIRDRIGARPCTQETLQEAVNYVLQTELGKREIQGVTLEETDTSRQVFFDGISPTAPLAAAAIPAPAPTAGLPGVPVVSANQLTRELTDKVDKLGANLNEKIKGLSLEVHQLQQLNLPKRPMQLGSEIVYTYAAIVGRRWTPTREVLIDGKLCGKDDKSGKQVNRRCRVVELKEEGQFACSGWGLFHRTCYELTLEEEAEDGSKNKVKSRFDVTRSRDDLPSQVYLPMLADAEKHAGTQPVVGDTTYQRLVNVQRSRNEHDYERSRTHIGALAAVNAENSQALLTAAALHLYLSEQPWLPGRIDLIRRTSIMVMYGNLDLGVAKTKTLGVGASIDIVRGFSLTFGYSRYTLDSSLDPLIPVGTEVHTGAGFAGLSINTEIVNNNKSLAGFFGQ